MRRKRGISSAVEFFSAGWGMNTFSLKQLFEGLFSSPARHGYVIPAQLVRQKSLNTSPPRV